MILEGKADPPREDGSLGLLPASQEQKEGRAHVDSGAKTGSSGDSVKATGILTFEPCANNSQSVLLSEFNDIFIANYDNNVRQQLSLT